MPGSGKRSVHQGLPKLFLIKLSDLGPLRTSDFEEMLNMQRPNVCACLRVLRRKSYIETERDSEDRRITRHQITTEGRSFLDGAYADPVHKDKFYIHEEIKHEKGDMSYAEYKNQTKKIDRVAQKSKIKDQESLIDYLLEEEF